MGKFKTGCLGVIGVVVVLGVIGSLIGGGDKDNNSTSSKSSTSSSAPAQKQDAKQKVYNDADINVLLAEAKDNAAAANQNYKGKDVKIIGGYVGNIDSDLKYISIDGTEAKYSMMHVSCSIDGKNQQLKDAVLKLKKKQNVVIYGTITEAGDLMGYRLKMDKIEPAQ